MKTLSLTSSAGLQPGGAHGRSRFTRVCLNLGLATGLGLMAPVAHSAPLDVQVTGLNSDQGEVRCGLFAGEEGWRDEDHTVRAATAKINQQAAHCDFGDVPPGHYAVALFHAAEGETRVSYGFLGKPRQGVGFSNNPSITFGPPDYAKAAFDLGTEPLTLQIQMKY